LIGTYDDRGLPITGEIEKVANARSMMANWLSLTPDQEESITQRFEEILRGRSKSVNPLNKDIANRAAQIASLKDSSGPYAGQRKNPRAKMAQTLPLQDDMIERHKQLGDDAIVNRSRSIKLGGYIIDENLRLENLIEAIDQLADNENLYYAHIVLNVSKNIRFRVQAANQYISAFDSLPGSFEECVLDKDLLGVYKQGIQFARHKNYLLHSFRPLASGNHTQLSELTVSELEDKHMSVLERLAALEEMPMPGPYNKLKGRLLKAGGNVVKALEARDSKTVKLTSLEYKRLINYHCLPRDDEDFDTWYKHAKKK